jgi:hypothetical protein
MSLMPAFFPIDSNFQLFPEQPVILNGTKWSEGSRGFGTVNGAVLIK